MAKLRQKMSCKIQKSATPRGRKWGRKGSQGVALRPLNWHIVAELWQKTAKIIILPQKCDPWGSQNGSKNRIKMKVRPLPTPGVAVFFRLLLLYTNLYRRFHRILRHLSVGKVSAMKKFQIAQMGSQLYK